MRYLMKVAMLVLIVTLLIACSQGNTEKNGGAATSADAEPLNEFIIPVPTAPGINVERDENAMIDYSNIHDGYVIVEYSGKSDKTLRVVVVAPHGEIYIYALSDGGFSEIIPITEGDGEYTIGVYEHIEADNYGKVISIKTNVTLKDGFLPFIHPNQFVNFTSESELVALAAELTKNAKNTEEKIAAIYNYVVDNFSYDYDLAASVRSGYIPDLDDVLHKKEGICFDYSALVTAMLRSQGIPTRLEIGYHGQEYHAWISKYCDINGWIENRYHYDGNEWYRMDPTVESGERKSHNSRQHARDDDEYRLMYNY